MAKDPDNSAPTAEKTADDKVSLIAIGSFHQDGNFQGKLLQSGDAFSTDRGRAVELRANGLVRYADDQAEKDAAADDAPGSTDNGVPVITTRSIRKVKT